MRLHTFVASFAFLALLAGRAPAGDDAPKPPKKDTSRAISEEEWIAKVQDVDRVDAVGVKKKDVLAFHAKKNVVLVRSKIWDVRQTAQGIEVDIVEVMPVPAAMAKHRLPRAPIVLAAEDKEAIKDWKRWDRLTFKMKPAVAADGALSYQRLIESVADVGRIANPGIEYPPPGKPLAGLDAFGPWVERYARAFAVPDWRAAWKYYQAASAQLFPVSATVRQGAPNVQGRGPRAPVTLEFAVTGTTGSGLYGLPTTTARVLIEDPQVTEALPAGARAELYFRVHGFEDSPDMAKQRGRFLVDVSFGKVR